MLDRSSPIGVQVRSFWWYSARKNATSPLRPANCSRRLVITAFSAHPRGSRVSQQQPKTSGLLLNRLQQTNFGAITLTDNYFKPTDK